MITRNDHNVIGYPCGSPRDCRLCMSQAILNAGLHAIVCFMASSVKETGLVLRLFCMMKNMHQ